MFQNDVPETPQPFEGVMDVRGELGTDKEHVRSVRDADEWGLMDYEMDISMLVS